jgi:hypothetical protein
MKKMIMFEEKKVSSRLFNNTVSIGAIERLSRTDKMVNVTILLNTYNARH